MPHPGSLVKELYSVDGRRGEPRSQRGQPAILSRQGNRTAFGLLLAALAVVVTLVAYAFFVEPYWVQITRHSFPGSVTAPLRIAHITDLHTRGFGTRERALLDSLRAEKPDLIVLTGDIADPGHTAAARTLLAQLRAPLGIWVALSRTDVLAPSGTTSMLRTLGAKVLSSEGEAVRPDVWLTGFEDPSTKEPNVRGALAKAPAASFKIALFHAPSVFPRAAGQVDLALAGRTHGGQVNLPGLTARWLTPEDGRYVHGWYRENSSYLYVSRGIGTANLPARFLSRPELAIIEIRPK